MPGDSLIVIGLDPGTRATGWGIIIEVSGQARLVETGVIRPKSEDSAERLGEINAQVEDLVRSHKPDVAAVENVFAAKNAASALKLGQARGAAIAACVRMGLRVHSYEPTMVKKNIVGVGRADKAQVAFMVGRLLGGLKPQWPLDASDALAVALCHLNMRRFQKLLEKER